MKISFERSGGFAGNYLSIDIELDQLPATDAEILRILIQDADLFHFSASQTGTSMADGFIYKLSVEDDGEHCTVRIGERALPENLQPLVNDLSSRARIQRHAA